MEDQQPHCNEGRCSNLRPTDQARVKVTVMTIETNIRLWIMTLQEIAEESEGLSAAESFSLLSIAECLRKIPSGDGGDGIRTTCSNCGELVEFRQSTNEVAEVEEVEIVKGRLRPPWKHAAMCVGGPWDGVKVTVEKGIGSFYVDETKGAWVPFKQGQITAGCYRYDWTFPGLWSNVEKTNVQSYLTSNYVGKRHREQVMVRNNCLEKEG